MIRQIANYMTIERYREIFKEKSEALNAAKITDQIAKDRQFIQAFIQLAFQNKLTIPSNGAHYG